METYITYRVQIERGDDIIPVQFPEGTALAHVVDFAQEHPGAYVIAQERGRDPRFLYWIDDKGRAIECK